MIGATPSSHVTFKKESIKSHLLCQFVQYQTIFFYMWMK